MFFGKYVFQKIRLVKVHLLDFDFLLSLIHWFIWSTHISQLLRIVGKFCESCKSTSSIGWFSLFWVEGRTHKGDGWLSNTTTPPKKLIDWLIKAEQHCSLYQNCPNICWQWQGQQRIISSQSDALIHFQFLEEKKTFKKLILYFFNLLKKFTKIWQMKKALKENLKWGRSTSGFVVKFLARIISN